MREAPAGVQARAARSAEGLRAALTDRLRAQGAIRSPEVAKAFQAVPRHIFIPGEPLEWAYADDSVVTKRDAQGVAMSSVSAPWLQATMLEQARISAGMRVLEIGSGGYNAALIAELAGPAGEVTTVDIDPDVTGRASQCLAEAGYTRVRVVLGDAEHGVTEHAPYDRIIVTAGAWDIPPAWAVQLAAGDGRIVVPLRLRGLTRSVAFERTDGHLASRDHVMCGFVPIQGAGSHAERLILLHGQDVGLRIEDRRLVDVKSLADALLRPRVEAWSGVSFGGQEPFDGLYLWLAARLPGFGLLTRQRTDAARQLANPSSPLGTPTLIEGRSFAYHTFRRIGAASDTWEFGACAHGPDASHLATRMTDQIRAWEQHRDSAAQITAYPSGTPDSQLPPGRVLDRRHARIIISWPQADRTPDLAEARDPHQERKPK